MWKLYERFTTGCDESRRLERHTLAKKPYAYEHMESRLCALTRKESVKTTIFNDEGRSLTCRAAFVVQA